MLEVDVDQDDCKSLRSSQRISVGAPNDPPDREGRGTIDESFSVLAVSLTRVDLGRSKWDKPDIDSTPNPKGPPRLSLHGTGSTAWTPQIKEPGGLSTGGTGPYRRRATTRGPSVITRAVPHGRRERESSRANHRDSGPHLFVIMLCYVIHKPSGRDFWSRLSQTANKKKVPTAVVLLGQRSRGNDSHDDSVQ